MHNTDTPTTSHSDKVEEKNYSFTHNQNLNNFDWYFGQYMHIGLVYSKQRRQGNEFCFLLQVTEIWNGAWNLLSQWEKWNRP